MRVSARQGYARIDFHAGTTRPVTMHLCGTTYRMESSEALDIANQLADAVEGLKAAEKQIEQGDN